MSLLGIFSSGFHWFRNEIQGKWKINVIKDNRCFNLYFSQVPYDASIIGYLREVQIKTSVIFDYIYCPSTHCSNPSAVRRQLSADWCLYSTHCQGRLLHWSMDAACVLEKDEGERKSCIFSWKLGGRKTKLLKHIFALFSSYFLKNFLACSSRSITFYFHPPIRGRGSYTAGTVKSVSLLKVGRKSVDFSSHFWWPDVTKLITQNLN